MAKFFDNLRRATTPFNNSSNSSTGVNSWDPELISEALEERWAGLDKSENPMLSLNVDIPRTPSVVKIQTGKYKLNNDTNTTGINNDNALYIVGNTYQDNDDGTHYGMGWDGRPYSYTIKENVVGDFTPLGVDEQKKAINRLSNGKITIHETITNPATLAEIYRSIKRMNENGNGNLIPDHVVIGDSDPGSIVLVGGDGTMGIARQGFGTKKEPDHIDLLGSDFPSIQADISSRAHKQGWFSAGGGDSVPQHELAHTAEFALLSSPDRYYNEVVKEAEKYKGKYSAGDLWADAFDKIKYAIPLLSDAVFGTHLRPSKEDVYSMLGAKNESIQELARFWYNYYRPLEEKFNTVEEKMTDDAWYGKAKNWYNKNADGKWSGAQSKLFEQAAKNAGFDSVEDAIASVSEYATSNKTEAFAEAYSDVLLNGGRAKPFSKELIRLYSELADDTAKMFGKNKPKQLQVFNQLIDILPEDVSRDPKKQLNRFQQNYRLFSE